MRVLVIGGGGREHALVHSIVASPLRPDVFCAPGNAGIAAEAECLAIGAEDTSGLLDWAARERPDLTVVGPEAPLVAGLTDALGERGLLVFGPSQAAAQMEGSKAFAKGVMDEAKAPTGRYRLHRDLDDALRCIELQETFPLVVKADGLAAGKGVIIADDRDAARSAVEECLVRRSFGDAGDSVIIEQYLRGSEVSLLVLCDGETAVPLAPAQDYKRIFDGDRGPNTGGMGSYCPVPGFEQTAIDAAMEQVVEPVLATLKRRGIPYRGVLYAGLIVTDDGTKVLEFNCRFGDPETQAVLPRLDSDLLELCLASAKGELAGVQPVWKPQDCVTVVLASAGYPAGSRKGDAIMGLEDAAALPGVTVYHAGTAWGEPATPVSGERVSTDPTVVTSGGRVLAVSALGDGFAAARRRAYEAAALIHFDGRQSRTDIAERAMRAQAGEISIFPTTASDRGGS